MEENKSEFEKYNGHGVGAPQVLIFLDSMSKILKSLTNDVDNAVGQIQEGFSKSTECEEDCDKEECKDGCIADME